MTRAFATCFAWIGIATSLAGATVHFLGNQALDDATLKQVLADYITQINESGLSESRADDMAFVVELAYQERGFGHAKVIPELSSSVLRLQIDEGRRTLLKELDISGAKAIEEKTIRKFVMGPTREKAEEKALPYVAEDIAEGINRARGLYLAKGYLEVRIPEPIVTFSQSGDSARIQVSIDEGRKYSFGEVRFEKNAQIDPAILRGALSEILQLPYSEDRLRLIEQKVSYVYERNGFYRAEVTAVGLRDAATDGKIPVEIRVIPGRRFLFGDVTVRGTTKLRASFVKKRFSTLSGRTYDPELLDEVFQKQLGTGLYDQLRVTQIAGAEDVDLKINVEEARSKEIGFSIGYGTFEGISAGVRFLERNLFGYGRPFGASVELSQRTLSGELFLKDPWLFERDDLALHVRLYAMTRDLEGYTKREYGLRPEVSWTITPRLKASAFLASRIVEISDAGIADELLGRQDYFANGLGLAFVYDARDNPVNPSRGAVFGGTGEIVSRTLGSEISYWRITGRASYYLPLGNCLLAAGARSGLMAPIESDEDVPIDERFFNGGASTVRSFADRELGPQNHGYPIGGESYTVFNLEFIIPVANSIKAAVFLDAGSLGRNAGNFGKIRYGIGAGLRYNLPIGPVRLDYGWNPDPQEHESSGALHFTFGFAF